MAKPFTLFEISWEICNKVGGIHTVISTKAKTLVDKMGDDYIAIGPWGLSDVDHDEGFKKEAGFEGFEEACREMGVPVQVGRWRIPGEPRTILVEFSKLYDEKDGILSGLWENFEVDSISGGWDYVEPVLFGHAAGRVIERWWEEFLARQHKRAVAHAHEWMTASSLLYVKEKLPAVGTVFTTHATMLGRALSSLGHSPEDGLGGREPSELAEENGVVSKHSMEGIAARESDVFTTVSEVTAEEAGLLHARQPDPITPNGLDLSVVDALAGDATRQEARAKLAHEASCFLGTDVSEAMFLAVSGRYEFHNKGIDMLLDALARIQAKPGRPIVLFALIPAGNSGVRDEQIERRSRDLADIEDALGISTHHLFDEDNDPIHEHCKKVGLTNKTGDRIQVVQVPIYLSEKDDFLGLSYLAVLRAMDLSAFPSYYEPWGYTPQESLAVGVPTITTDYAGFGHWARKAGIEAKQGVTVLSRVGVHFDAATESLVDAIETFMDENRAPAERYEACRATALKSSWSDFVGRYDTAYNAALESVQGRMARGVPQVRRPRTRIALEQQKGSSPRLFSFDVATTIPDELSDLKRLSMNYWWCWDHDAPKLFEELSPEAWRKHGHNPRAFLHHVSPEDLAERSRDQGYRQRLKQAVQRFDTYMGASPVNTADAPNDTHPIAYFCAEFGLHESLRVYSGGLGILAGDHLKSASDLNLPLVAVGLFYAMGYMGQKLSPTGDQIAVDLPNDPRELALRPVRAPGDASGHLVLELNLPGRKLHLKAWEVNVGRVSLYLLDADHEHNRSEDRALTRNLYGGDSETRLQQEIILGRGGVRLLRALGIRPSVYHMNEGHAAFLTLERIGELAREGASFAEAHEFVCATTLFTTHTPVPAGHDRFSEELLRRYFSDVEKWLGVPWERFYALGQADGDQEDFNMSYLALSCSSFCNGVSKLHGTASRELLRAYWPRLLEAEVPIDTVTNGIHLPTWTHPRIAQAMGVVDRPVTSEDFERLGLGASPRIWKAKVALKHDLLGFLRERIERRGQERGESPALLSRIVDGLDEKALYIGFARRFAPYKRADLMFHDADRLAALLNSTDRPLRILVAGKAHPADGLGRDLIKRIAERTREDAFVGRVFLLEDYDIELARHLLQGVDVWLNNPKRMQEASGTSGMKGAANGTLHLSIGDGWWPEAFDGENGWTLGGESVYEDSELQDELDANSLYRLLEDELLPSYFERDIDGIPKSWVARVVRCLASIPCEFNTDRMVDEYHDKAYQPLGSEFSRLSTDNRWQLRSRVQERKRLQGGFASVSFEKIEVSKIDELAVGDALEIHVDVRLGVLQPDDVNIELILDQPEGAASTLTVVPLGFVQELDGVHVFEGAQPLRRSGNFSYGVRVTAKQEFATGRGDLVVWA